MRLFFKRLCQAVTLVIPAMIVWGFFKTATDLSAAVMPEGQFEYGMFVIISVISFSIVAFGTALLSLVAASRIGGVKFEVTGGFVPPSEVRRGH